MAGRLHETRGRPVAGSPRPRPAPGRSPRTTRRAAAGLLLVLAAAVGCGPAAGTSHDASVGPRAAAPPAPGAGRLVLYSGGHVRPILQPLVRDFAKSTGDEVSYRTGPSGTMLAECIERKADLYIAADLRHVRAAEQRNLVAAKLPLAHHRLAIIVKRGNPKGVRRLEDLARAGMKVFVEDPTGCQVGTATQRLLARNDVTLRPATVRMKGEPPTPGNVVRFIRAGLLDAAIVWDSAAARLTGQVDVVAIPPDRNVAANIVAVLFRFSAHKALGERFILFLRDENSRPVWRRHGFRPGPAPAAATVLGEPSRAVPKPEPDLKRSAERMIRASRGLLAPVYAPLAEQIVSDLDLPETRGIGIDLGSGPGDLIIELCRRTRLHWINADINPHFFAHFRRLAEVHGLSDRVSAVLADAQALPFRDNYADVIVSRGSYQFWPDRRKGFAEIRRVLKPGGVAYVGRGFSGNLPVETARAIRARQGRRMEYDRRREADALRAMLAELGVGGLRVRLPRPAGGEDVNYGVWVQFRKAEEVPE